MASPSDDPVGNPAPNARALYSLRALGREGLPNPIEIDGIPWRLTLTVKHDFWAVTGFYEDPTGRKAVLKMGRVAPFAGLPLKWIGRMLCNREVRFYNRMADLPNVPMVLGRVGETGFVHAFVEGRPLSKERPVPDRFFDRLNELMLELHRRDIAYVDTNKPENILLGDDGLPHLIDFQISYDLHTFGNWFLARYILRRLQQADLYHILKHKKRLRKDELTPDELARAEHRAWFIRLHRFLAKPYFIIRRRLFKKLRESGRLLPEGSK